MEQRINAYEKGYNAIKPLFGLGAYLAKSSIEQSLLHLTYFRVSQLNGCAYCLDMHAKDLRAMGETEQRIYLLAAWREAPFYTERERAALAWAEAVTTLPEGNVPDAIYAAARKQFSEEELIDLTINKRLFRAKEKLRTEKVKMELPPENEIANRHDNVLHIIYLLFNEGYYSQTQNQILRKDLCLEAMRLGVMLTEYGRTNRPKTNALLALMCFHASRFNARQTSENAAILYEQQNAALWDTALIKQGMHFLHLSAQGEEVSSYHLEARIAYWHCIKEDTREKWEDILQLYNQLLLVNYSPSVALNRVFALYKAKGYQAALAEAEKLNLDNNHFYFLLLGELYKNIDNKKAKSNFQKAYALAKTQTEKQGIQEKIDSLN